MTLRIRRVCFVLFLLPAAVHAAPPAAPDADDKAAKSLYVAAQQVYETGEFLAAARLFERASAKAPREATLMYNAASAYDKGGDRANALVWYQKFLATGATGRDASIASARMQVIEREMREIEAAKARPAIQSLPFVEPITKHAFETNLNVDGKAYALIGVGARKVFGFKVYAMGLYVEDEPARKAFPRLAAQAGGADHETLSHSDLAHKFVVLGEFGKTAVLHFTRACSAKDTRDAYKEALDNSQNGPPSPALQRDIAGFLELFDDVREGEEIRIHTTADGHVSVEAQGQRRQGPTNLRLAHDIWDIWLGSKPISADLKKTIIGRIETLGH